jgi:hypothetical protein
MNACGDTPPLFFFVGSGDEDWRDQAGELLVRSSGRQLTGSWFRHGDPLTDWVLLPTSD